MSVLALDQSTSATKAVLFDETGRMLDAESLEHRQIYPRPGWVEHDAEEIWRNTVAVLTGLLDRHASRVAGIACLSLANQRETVVVFDRRTGAPLHHAIVWQCGRSGGICRELSDAGHDDLVRSKTGLRIDTYFSATKLTWLVRHHPEVAKKLASGDAVIGTVDAFLVHRLTGGAVFATDHTNASRTLLFDIDALAWDDELCRLFEVPRQALPEVRESAAVFGETDLAGHLPKPLPIAGVMGDSQASMFAQRCHEPGAIKATFGTGCSVLLNLGDTRRPMQGQAVTAVAWVHRGRPTYAFEGIINYAAATVNWLKDQLGLIGNAAETQDLALSVPDNGGVYLVPAFAGLSAPHWAPEARAAIVGLTAHATKAHVVRAALESIAYQLGDVLEMMQADADVTLRHIQADGGPTANRFLMQFTADVAGVELHAADVPNVSPLGAAFAGLLAMGVHGTLDAVAALPRDATVYTPRADRQGIDPCIDGWHQAVDRVLLSPDAT